MVINLKENSMKQGQLPHDIHLLIFNHVFDGMLTFPEIEELMQYYLFNKQFVLSSNKLYHFIPIFELETERCLEYSVG